MKERQLKIWLIILTFAVVFLQGGFAAGWWPWSGFNQPLIIISLIFCWWLPLRTTWPVLLAASIILESMRASPDFGLVLAVGLVLSAIALIQSSGWLPTKNQQLAMVAIWLVVAYGLQLFSLHNSLQPLLITVAIFSLVFEILIWQLVVLNIVKPGKSRLTTSRGRV